MSKPVYGRKWLGAWLAWGVTFGLLEAAGLSKSFDKAPPLTYVFRRYIPQVVGIGLCAWLLFHAGVTYQTPIEAIDQPEG